MMTFKAKVINTYRRKHGGNLPRELTPAYIAKNTTWDWQTIKRQPAWFIEDMLLLIQAESKVSIEQSKKSERESRKKGKH